MLHILLISVLLNKRNALFRSGCIFGTPCRLHNNTLCVLFIAGTEGLEVVTLHGGDMDWSNEWCQIGPPVGDSRYYLLKYFDLYTHLI